MQDFLYKPWSAPNVAQLALSLCQRQILTHLHRIALGADYAMRWSFGLRISRTLDITDGTVMSIG